VSHGTAALFTHPLGEDAALLPRTTEMTDAYQALLVANYARLARWFPRAFDTPPTPTSTRSELERAGLAWPDGSQLPMVITAKSGDDWRLVGWVNLVIDSAGRSAEVGYWLHAGSEGRGLATRAVTVVLDHAFGPLVLHRVELQATTDHARSRSLPQRLAFTQEGVPRGGGTAP
jgi:RimJ/RimL family protein N-acetyltransferase